MEKKIHFLRLSCIKIKGEVQGGYHIKLVKVSTSHPTPSTDNPLYTDTQYNDTTLYNDNLTVKKPSFQKKQLIINYARILF